MNTALTLLAALACAQNFIADAQTTYDVADCSDLLALPSFTADAVIDFTASPISCDANVNMRAIGGITLELKSSLTELKLVNVRLSLQSGSSAVVSAPNIQWQSEETREDITGAAVSVTSGSTATFMEDVTFVGCSIVRNVPKPSGGAISNQGNLEFMSDVAFIGTTEGGGLFNSGNVTFFGDALFEDNKNFNGFYISGGGGLSTDDGNVVFEGAANFIGNEVIENQDTISGMIQYDGGKGGGLHAMSNKDGATVVFKGPVLFSGNKALEGAGLYVSFESPIVFQDLVTFENNVVTSIGDASGGGAMHVSRGTVEFQAGVVATGNVAKDGGAFKVSSDGVVNIDGPVTMTDNEARYEGGAIWNAGVITIPEDALISGNTAVMCPGIKNYEDWERVDPIFTRRWSYPDGYIEFSGGGSTYSGSSIDICYLGEDVGNGPDLSMTIDSETADCDALFGAGATLGGYSVLTWDTRVLSGVSFEVGAEDFEISCAKQSIIFVTGGGEITVTSSADSLTFSNIRFEVRGYSDLYFDVPELIMTGIDRSVIGGSTHVDKDSSLEFWGDAKFIDNTLAYMTDTAWNEYGGAAVFNAGLVMFRGQAYFRGNGQFEQYGMYSWNVPGGAILNVGSIEFVGKAKFRDNFNLRGGDGGGIANGAQVWFNRRTVWRNNTVELRYAEEGSSIYGGHGAALYNYGPFATTEFYSKANFKENVGGFRGCAVGAVGYSGRGEVSSSYDVTNKITFGHETFFKDNSCDMDHEDTGGAGLWVYGDAMVEFQDRVVFRRNEAINGGAIINGGGMIRFASADLLDMTDNVGSESCPDIKNYDKDIFDHSHSTLFGDINDPFGECGSSNDLCTWHVGKVTIGSADTVVGETSDICEF